MPKDNWRSGVCTSGCASTALHGGTRASRRRPPEALKTLTCVGRSNRRQMHRIPRLNTRSNGVQIVSAAYGGSLVSGPRRPRCDLADMSDQR
jgi:hypothetical protein